MISDQDGLSKTYNAADGLCVTVYRSGFVCSVTIQQDKQNELQVCLKLEALTWRCLSADGRQVAVQA